VEYWQFAQRVSDISPTIKQGARYVSMIFSPSLYDFFRSSPTYLSSVYSGALQSGRVLGVSKSCEPMRLFGVL